jgi:hypothetical protein
MKTQVAVRKPASTLVFTAVCILCMVGAMQANIYAAWIGFLLGCLAGAVPGLFFHGHEWLGGYSSWRRRMIRLAHVAFFGVGLLNLSFALTTRALELVTGLRSVSTLLIAGAITMPLVCYLSAWKPAFRNLFFIPAGSITVGIALFTWRIVSP